MSEQLPPDSLHETTRLKVAPFKYSAFPPPQRAHLLIYCNAFNPVTNFHMRLCEVSEEHYEHVQVDARLLGIILSPVHHRYEADYLQTCHSDPQAFTQHRLAMLRLATGHTQRHNVFVDEWESVKRSSWTPTLHVLRRYRRCLRACLRELLHECEDSEEDFEDEDYVKGEDYLCSSALKKHLTEWLQSFLDQQAKQEQVALAAPISSCALLSAHRRISVRLLCSSHLLNTMLDESLWPVEDVRSLLNEFGVTCVRRSGFDIDRLVYSSDLFYPYRRQIDLLHDWLSASSDMKDFQRALRRGESVRHLIPSSVGEYIERYRLYGTTVVSPDTSTPPCLTTEVDMQMRLSHESHMQRQQSGLVQDESAARRDVERHPQTVDEKSESVSLPLFTVERERASKHVSTQTRLTAIGEQSSWLATTPNADGPTDITTALVSQSPEQTIQRLLRVCQECGSRRARLVLIEKLVHDNKNMSSDHIQTQCHPPLELSPSSGSRSGQLVGPSSEESGSNHPHVGTQLQNDSNTVDTAGMPMTTQNSSSGSSSSGTRKLERDIELILRRLQTHEDPDDYL